MKIEYFGTDLASPGHYRWEIVPSGIANRSLHTRDLPFDPEGLVHSYLPVGSVTFFQCPGYTVLGISGSAIDLRPGSISVFWVNELITRKALIEILHKDSVCSRLISAVEGKHLINIRLEGPEHTGM